MAYPRSQRSRALKFVTRTSGDLALDFTDSTWRAVNGTAWDITLPAQVGDAIAISLNFRCLNGNNTGFDVMSIVSAAPVNCASGVAYSSSTNAGIGAMFHALNQSGGHSCYIPFVMALGDLASGIVTLRPMFRNVSGIGAGSACTVYGSASGGIPFFSAQNIGPVAAH